MDNEFVTQDVMEYGVWGYVGPNADGTPSVADATNMANWKLLSDVVGFENSQATIDSDGHPAFTFGGDDGPDAAAPVKVWNITTASLGYTRDYVFCDAYRYLGVRSSAISKDATLSATRPGRLG